MGPNYISNMVAVAQANTSPTLPKPPTRENIVAGAATPHVPGSSSDTFQSRKAETYINIEPPVAMSPAQVRSNTRHVPTQRPSNTPGTSVSPAPPPIPTSSITPIPQTESVAAPA